MVNDGPLHQYVPTKDVLMYDDIELKCPYKNYDKLSWFKVRVNHEYTKIYKKKHK